MTTPIEQGAKAINKKIGAVFPGAMGMNVSTELSRSVFGSINSNDLHQVLDAHTPETDEWGAYLGSCQCGVEAVAFNAHLSDAILAWLNRITP